MQTILKWWGVTCVILMVLEPLWAAVAFMLGAFHVAVYVNRRREAKGTARPTTNTTRSRRVSERPAQSAPKLSGAQTFKGRKPNPRSRPSTQPRKGPSFGLVEMRTNSVQVKLGPQEVSAIDIQIKGRLVAQGMRFNPEIRLAGYDVTEGLENRQKILCVIEALQGEQKQFRLVNKQSGGWTHDRIIPEFSSLLKLPVFALVFPRSGSRVCELELSVRGDGESQYEVLGTHQITVRCAQPGYLEQQEERWEAIGYSLQLGLTMAASDQQIDIQEITTIKKLLSAHLDQYPPAERKSRLDRMNELKQDALTRIRGGEALALEREVVETLKNFKQKHLLYEVLEFCLGVLKADGEVNAREMEQINRLAKELRLDLDKVRMLTDKHLVGLDMAPGEGSEDSDSILGINPGMNKKEIKSLLNKLYRKYQARSTHDQPHVRDDAKKWLEKIAEARVRHLRE